MASLHTSPVCGIDSETNSVVIPDAFGWEFVNNPPLLVDEYARNGGFTVFMPDFRNDKSFVVVSDFLVSFLHHRPMYRGSIYGMVFCAGNFQRNSSMSRD